jgi:hypothetical protein
MAAGFGCVSRTAAFLALMAFSALEQLAEHRVDVRQVGDALHGEAAGVAAAACSYSRHRFCGSAVGDLDVGEVLHQRQEPSGQQFAAMRRVVVPVVAVGGLRP